MSKVTSVDIARQYKEWWNSRLKLTVYRKALMVCCILPLAFSSSFSLDLTQDYRPFSPSGVTDTNPYGLVDLDHFDPGDFTHCRWGVYQDQAEASHVKRELKFSHLTAEPFSYRNKDLFISSSIDYILRLALPIEAPSSTEAVWSEPDGENDGNVKYYLREETEYLFRKLHFKIKDTLIDKHTGQSLNDHSRKIIIIIHGWNASSSSNQFEGSLGILSSWVERVTEGSDWSVVDYHWEKDADTGNSKVDHLLHGYNTPEAAEIGHTHGQHLGELISTLCPYVKKVHFIAHSAGSWVARSATKHLLKFRDNASLQVTFLDPFIPNKINASSTLSAGNLAEMDTFPNADRIFYLENIFAIDNADPIVAGVTNTQCSDYIYYATSESFLWSLGINQRVDWQPAPFDPEDSLPAEFYDSHDGPISFYNDTIMEAQPEYEKPNSLANPAFDLTKVGWRASMFMNEPRFTGTLVSSQSQTINPGDPLSLTATADTRSGAFTGSATWQWFKVGDPNPLEGQISNTLSIPSVISDDQGKYYAEVTYNGLISRSGAAEITVAGAEPFITNQPLSTTVAPGSDAQFSVTATGSPPLAYQWMLDGLDIAGATSPSVTINSVTSEDSGREYSVSVSNAGGAVTSQVAVLTVSQSATGDIYEPNDSSMTATSMGTSDTRQAYIGSPSDADWFSVNVTEAGPLTINLTVPAGLDYDLELYGPDALFKAGSYGDAGADESITYNVTTLGTYTFRVYGWPVGAGSWSATDAYTISTGFISGGITISSQPQICRLYGAYDFPMLDSLIYPGAPAQISVEAYADSGIVSYQWQRNGSDIPGATRSSFTVAETEYSNEGDLYRVIISNDFTSIVSEPVALDLDTEWYTRNEWQGNVSQSWHDPLNWSLGSIPDNGDTIIIPSGETVIISSDAECSQVLLSGTLKLTGGEFYGGVFVKTGGKFEWLGGEFDYVYSGSGVFITPDGKMMIDGENEKRWDDNIIVINQGDLYWAGAGTLNLANSDNGYLINEELGTVHITTDVQTTGNSANELIIDNYGVLVKSGGLNEALLNGVTLNNDSEFMLEVGSVRFSSLHQDGVVDIASSANLLFSGGSATGVFTGDGKVDLSGSISGTLRGPNFRLASGSLYGAFSLEGSLEWSGGDFGVLNPTYELHLTIAPGGEFSITGNTDKYFMRESCIENHGSIIWSGAGALLHRHNSINYTSTGLIKNMHTGTISILADVSTGLGDTSSKNKGWVLENYGTIIKDAGSGTSTFSSLTANNYGVIDLSKGTVRFGTLNQDGVVDIASSANLLFSGGSATGIFTGDGKIDLSGSISGTLTGDFTLGADDYAKGAFSLSGSLTWSGGDLGEGNSSCYLTINPEAVLNVETGATKNMFNYSRITNHGTINWGNGAEIGGYRSGYSSTTIEFVNETGGEINLAGEGATIDGRPTWSNKAMFAIVNRGAINKTGGGAFTFGHSRSSINEGTINADGGELNLSNFSNSGLVCIASVARLSCGGNTCDNQGVFKGSGFVSGKLINNGRVEAGQSPGTLTIEGDYTHGANGVLESEIGGATPGTNYDQLIVTGDVNLDGQASIQLVDSYTPSIGDTFNVISCGGTLSGEFSKIEGTHISRDVVFAPEYTASAASLVTRSSQPYEQWAWDKFGDQVNNSSMSSYFKDPDGDGKINLLEYAFLQNPMQQNSGSPFVIEMIQEDGEEYLSITFDRPKNATDINFIPRVTSNLLQGWNTGVSFAEISRIIDNGDSETVTIRDKTPVGSAGSRYMTVDVEVSE